MKDDLISRSALLEELKKGYIDNAYCVVKVKQQPAVDAEEILKNLSWVKETLEMAKKNVAPVRRGQWIAEKCNHKPCRIKNPEKWVIYKCSACGYSNGRKQSNYCPDCGAKMKQEV